MSALERMLTGVSNEAGPGAGSSVPPPLDDEERAFRAAFGRLVDWYRVEQSPALFRAFLPAFVLLPLGSLLVGVSLMQRYVSLSAQPLVLLSGLLLTASGPLWAVIQLLRTIRRDLYVAIRVDGLSLRLDPRESERFYTWEVIEDARYDEAARTVSVQMHEGAPLVIADCFSELELPELAARIRDARRLAVWNRLEPRFAASEGPTE